MNPDRHRSEHGLLRELLRRFLAELESSGDPGGISGVSCGAAAALDSLLAAHPVDARGRCRLCRRRGWLARRRRVCMVFQKTHYWLRQRSGQLPAQLGDQWGIDLRPPSADRRITQMLSGITADPSGDPSRTPAVPLPLPARPFLDAGRLDPDHGGAGVHLPDGPWPRRGPVDNPLPGPGPAVLLTGSVPWPG